jgi:hypothetical protein
VLDTNQVAPSSQQVEQTPRNRLCRAAGVAPLRGSGEAASGVVMI